MSRASSETSQTSNLSDISSFAAWELLHPSNLAEENSREPSVLAADMARPERVWKDRDSSNDARSSGDEGEESLPVVRKEKIGKRKRDRKSAGLIGGDLEIPSSTADTFSQGKSQDLVSLCLLGFVAISWL